MLQKYVDSLLELITVYQASESSAAQPELMGKIQEIKAKIDLEFLKGDVVKLISESREGVERVKKIIQDLKDFSHPSGSNWESYDINKGLESTLNIVRNEIKSKQIVLTTELVELPSIKAVGSQLNQVFLNILINAIHAVPQHGKINIKTSHDSDHVYLKIYDSGVGIKSEDFEKIFEPFFTTKKVGQGTGLGLYLSYGIIQKHQGNIDVASEVGHGTTFTISLPIKQVEAHEDQPQ